MKSFNNYRGYTLIELLVVMVILVTVGTIIAGIIVSSLRGSNRSKNVGDVRQAGNSALIQMSKTIKYAKDFDGVSNGTADLNNNLINTSNCTASGQTRYKYLQITSFDQSQTTYICQDDKLYSTNATTWNKSNLLSSSKELIDSGSFNVFTDSCFFVCTQTNISVPPTISINFTVSTNSNPAFIENRVSQDFKASAAFRNNGN